MKNILRHAVQLQKEHLIHKLIKSGIYKKNDKHLYELTLSELENEYKYVNKDNPGTMKKIGKQKNQACLYSKGKLKNGLIPTSSR